MRDVEWETSLMNIKHAMNKAPDAFEKDPLSGIFLKDDNDGESRHSFQLLVRFYARPCFRYV